MSNEVKNTVTMNCTTPEACVRKIEFTTPADAVGAAFKKALKNVMKHVQIPGFRAGKAPASMVQKRYADYIAEDAEKALQGAAFELLSGPDTDLDIVAFGELDAKVKPAEGQDYVFSIQVEVAPEITLPEYKGMKLEVEAGEPVEAMLEKRLQQMKETYAEFLTISGATQAGDMVKVSYESDFEAAEDAPASLKHAVKAETSWIWLDQPEQFPGIVDALVGKETGTDVAVAVTFPADWREAGLQGKTVNYSFKLHEIQRRTPIESDEKLAEKMHMESVEKMKENLGKEVANEAEMALKGKKCDKVLEILLPCMDAVELPKGVVMDAQRREFQHIAESTVRSEADVEAFKADSEKHMAAAKEAAEKSMRKFFLLRKIAHQEKITVSQDDVDNRIQAMSYYSGIKPAEIRKLLEERNSMSDLQSDILMSKVLAFIVDNEAK